MISAVPHQSARPFTIFAACLDRALGEVFTRCMFASLVKMHTPDSSLTMYWRDDGRQYKRDILAMCPYIDRTISMGGNDVLPLDWFYPPADRTPIHGIADFVKAGHASPDLLLLPTQMLEIDMLRYPVWPRFAIPGPAQLGLRRALWNAGLQDDKWFCVMHYREPTFPLRGATPYRDVLSDAPFEELAGMIIDQLGGQVVRIGHKEMREWPARPGFVDLSRHDDFMLHACVISYARFAVMTGSGPASVPPAFGVPTMIANAVGAQAFGASPNFMMPRPIIAPNGDRLDIEAMMRNGRWTNAHIRRLAYNEGHRLEDNTADDMWRGVLRLYGETIPTGWREPEPEPQTKPMLYNPRGAYVRAINLMVP